MEPSPCSFWAQPLLRVVQVVAPPVDRASYFVLVAEVLVCDVVLRADKNTGEAVVAAGDLNLDDSGVIRPGDVEVPVVEVHELHLVVGHLLRVAEYVKMYAISVQLLGCMICLKQYRNVTFYKPYICIPLVLW